MSNTILTICKTMKYFIGYNIRHIENGLHVKKDNEFRLTNNKMKADYPCVLKIWLMYFLTFIFPFI